MRPDLMPSPGYLSNGIALTKEACRAISSAQIQLDLSPGSDIGRNLRKFFLDCADLVPAGPVLPKEKK